MSTGNDLQHPSEQEKVRCFGSSAALTVEATALLVDGEAAGTTVNLEVAPRNGDKVDWGKKIVTQLSEDELPIFTAICLGYLPCGKFSRSTKGIFVERQQNKLFFNATQGKGKHYVLPVPIGQTFNIACLALKQLKKHTGIDDGELLIAALRGSAALYSPKPS